MKRRQFLKTVATVGAATIVCPMAMADNLIDDICFIHDEPIDHEAFGEFLNQVATTNGGFWGQHIPKHFLSNIRKSITDVNMWNRMKKERLICKCYATDELIDDKRALGWTCEEGLIDGIKRQVVDIKPEPFSGLLNVIVSYRPPQMFYKFVFNVV